MSLTEPERKALRKRCSLVISGFKQQSPAEEFRQLAAWCEANDVEHDVYGDGELVEAFEKKIAALLYKPAAVFMPSGIMAQLAAVRIWAERAKLMRFGMHPTSHLASHEDESFAALMQLHGVPVGDRLRPMTSADLEAIRQPLACAIVELPIREAGGQLPTWDELESLKLTARQRGMPLHMDGARLWESAASYGRSYAEIADGFDSVYVSVYKGIGSFAGALLIGDDDFIANARLWRRRMGGTLHHLSPLLAPAAMRFDERIALMPALHERTLSFAAGLQSIAGLRVNPATPQTNMLHLYFDAAKDAVLDARDRLAQETGIWLIGSARAVDVPGWSATEIYIGDQVLQTDDQQLLPLFARLIEMARVPVA
jgi:threonine aldolase